MNNIKLSTDTYNTFFTTVNIQMNLQGGSIPQVIRQERNGDASKELYEAILPYNHMRGSEKYQFIDLSYNSNYTREDARELLENEGILEGREEAFLKAAEEYDISPIYLINHAILETGHGTSELANGYSYNGRIVYNMYGYGATDTNPIEGGAQIAFNNEWFTPEEAIIGGAEKIGENYIGNGESGQSTLYEMRWNPENPGQHQYATDIDWALKQTNIMNLEEIYDQVPKEELHFYIPVFPAERDGL